MLGRCGTKLKTLSTKNFGLKTINGSNNITGWFILSSAGDSRAVDRRSLERLF